jgi:hypothetical protein
MSLFKFLIVFYLLCTNFFLSAPAEAQTKSVNAPRAKAQSIRSRNGFAFALTSLYQSIKATSEDTTLNEEAMFFGGTFSIEKTILNRGRWILGYDGGLMFGNAMVGDTESLYFKKQVGYTGLIVGARALYRTTNFFDTGLRVGVSYLNITLPKIGTTSAQLEAKNPSMNAAAEFRFHLDPLYDLWQNLGLDVNNSRFFWKIGFSRLF